jgi:hemolysin activation/secretion protein
VKAYSLSGSLVSPLAILAATCVTPAFAQSTLPSRLVPSTFQPRPAAVARPLDIGRYSGAEIPAGAAKLTVRVGSVVLEGDLNLIPAARERLEATIRGKTLTVEELFAAARAYEMAHAEAGYVLTRVRIPPQRLVPGSPVKLVVVNGVIDTIDVSGLPERTRAPVSARVGRIVGKSPVTRGEIESALLTAGDLYALTLRSTFAPGDREGGTRLVLDGEQPLVSGNLGIDNRVSSRAGSAALSGAVSVNGAAGFGEQLYVAFGSDAEDPASTQAPQRIVAVGAVLPLGSAGITLSPEFAMARSYPEPVVTGLQTDESYMRGALRLGVPIIRETKRNLALNVGVEAVRQRVRYESFDTDASRDRYVVVRAGIDGVEAWDSASLGYGLTLSQGIAGRDGADAERTGVPLTRQGAEPGFTKLVAGLRGGVVVGPIAFAAIARGQSSFGQPLYSSEQMSLDGADAVSGFDAGDLSVDEGATLRLELSPARAYPLAWGITVVPYVFAAHGVGYLRGPTAVEQSFQRASSAGIGFRSELGTLIPGTAGTSLRVEYARSDSDPAVSGHGGHRVTLGLMTRF